MTTPGKNNFVTRFALAALLPLAAVACASAQQAGLAQSVPTLAVTGRAELSKPADELRLNVGVVTQHEEAAEAVRMNARRMNEMVAAIEGAGLDERDIETGRFQIHPVYSQRQRQQAEEWHPRIVAYRVTNTVHVKTPKIDRAGAIIDAATAAGANTIDSIQFTLADARIHREEAIVAATRNAMTDAQSLADAAGLRLVRIIAINLDDPPPVVPFRHDMMRMAVAEAAPDDPTPIRPGDVTVRATVNVIYEIAPREE